MNGAAPAIVHDARTQWLLRRRETLGASEVAAVLGADPRRGPLAVYCAKVGDVDATDTRWMKWGRRVEGAIAEGYADETGRPIVDLGAHEIQRHPDVPFLSATLDRITCGSAEHPAPIPGQDAPDAGPRVVQAPLECKAVGFQKKQDWQDEPPLEYVIQLQVQCGVTGAGWGSLCALIGGLTIAWKDLLRNDAFLAAAFPKLEEFWLQVQRREPPEADGLPGTSAAVRRLWSGEDGETIALDDDALATVTRWEQAKASRDAGETEADACENQLRARLGTASYAWLPDGSGLSLKLQKRGAYQVKPTEFRVLRRFRPKLRTR